MQERTSPVKCLRDRDGVAMEGDAEAKCDPALRPVNMRSCVGTKRCGYGFVGEEWGICSARCGDGVQTRAISCVRSDGERVDGSICEQRGLVRPPATQACNTIVGCTYFFDPTPWEACNTACLQFRTLTCTRSDGTQAEDYFCSSLPSLPTSRACC